VHIQVDCQSCHSHIQPNHPSLPPNVLHSDTSGMTPTPDCHTTAIGRAVTEPIVLYRQNLFAYPSGRWSGSKKRIQAMCLHYVAVLERGQNIKTESSVDVSKFCFDTAQ
jgi:hypothetical protein